MILRQEGHGVPLLKRVLLLLLLLQVGRTHHGFPDVYLPP